MCICSVICVYIYIKNVYIYIYYSMYIYIYVYIYINMFTYWYIYIYIYIWSYIYMIIYVCMSIHIIPLYLTPRPPQAPTFTAPVTRCTWNLGANHKWIWALTLEFHNPYGTFCIFPNIGNNHPNWLIFFRGVGQPPTSEWYWIYHLVI